MPFLGLKDYVFARIGLDLLSGRDLIAIKPVSVTDPFVYVIVSPRTRRAAKKP